MICKMAACKLNKAFRKSLLSLFSLIIFSLLSGAVFAANQNFPVSDSLGASGDWATVTGGAGITITIPTGFNLGSSDGTSTGFSVNAGAQPTTIVSFLGNSTVAGTIGITGGIVADVRGGAAGTSVIFNGQVNSTLISYTAASTMTFNATTNGALQFAGFNGTANVAAGVTYTGAATTTTANTGFIALNSGSVYTGAIGTPTFYLNTVTLNGNASITGAVASNNIVLGPNTLTQAGAVTFPTGASITVRANSDSSFGRINAAGSAINFTTGLQVNMLVEETTILSGSPLQVVTGSAGSGPNPAPITTTSNNVRFTFTGQHVAGTGNVLIFPSVVPLVTPGTPAAAAASAFDAAFFGATGDLLLVQQLVNALNNAQAIADAEIQFGPTANAGNAMMGFEALNQFQNLWSSNLAKARNAHICYDRCDPCNHCYCPTLCNPCCCADRKYAWNGEGFWLDGFGYFGDQKKRQLVEGYDSQMYGVMLAYQRHITERWQAGLGIGYAYTRIDGDGFLPENWTNINTYQVTAYLGYTRGPFYFDSFYTFDWNHYDGNRHIVFPGLNRTANASYDGQGYSILLATGYNYYVGCDVTVTPIAEIEFQKLHMDSYTETGATSLNLVQQSQSYNHIQSALGVMVGVPVPAGCCNILYTEAHAKWLYSIQNYRFRNSSRFQGGGPSFVTDGVTPAPNAINAGVSATLFTIRNLSFNLGYDAYYQSDYLGQQGSLSINYRF